MIVRLIDADKLIRDIEYYHLSDGMFQHWVEIQPIIEPEQKRSKWTYSIDDIFPMDSQMECGNCHASYLIYLCNEFKFCPNCGAKMEEEEE